MPNKQTIDLDQEVLFNFKWTRQRVQQLHQLSKHRGLAASAIIKGYLIEQFKLDGIDQSFDSSRAGCVHD